MSVLSTITRVFNHYGTRQDIMTDGATRQVTVFALPMDGGTIGTYFDGNESVGLVHPAAVLFVAGSEPNPPLAGDVFYDSDFGNRGDPDVLTVRKVQAFRLAGQIVLYECLCD